MSDQLTYAMRGPLFAVAAGSHIFFLRIVIRHVRSAYLRNPWPIICRCCRLPFYLFLDCDQACPISLRNAWPIIKSSFISTFSSFPTFNQIAFFLAVHFSIWIRSCILLFLVVVLFRHDNLMHTFPFAPSCRLYTSLWVVFLPSIKLPSFSWRSFSPFQSSVVFSSIFLF